MPRNASIILAKIRYIIKMKEKTLISKTVAVFLAPCSGALSLCMPHCLAPHADRSAFVCRIAPRRTRISQPLCAASPRAARGFLSLCVPHRAIPCVASSRVPHCAMSYSTSPSRRALHRDHAANQTTPSVRGGLRTPMILRRLSL